MLALERGAASMGAAVAIGRLDMTASALRAAASREKDGAAARRILALALVLDGADRKTAAETCGMDRQTLRDWVHRYNAEGLTGLHDLTPPGPKPKLTAEQQAVLAGLVETGPDPARHGVVRWRRVDLRDELQRRFGVALHERSVGKVLAKLGYCRLEPAVAELRQNLADRAFVQRDAEAPLQLVAQIHAPPAHHPVTSRVGARLDQPGQHRLLFGREFRLGTRWRQIVQPGQALGVVAMHPIPQGLPIHAAGFGRRLAIRPVEHQRKRQYPPRCCPVLLPARSRPESRCRHIKPSDRNRCTHRCCSSFKSQHRVRLSLIWESPNESIFGAVGISDQPPVCVSCCPMRSKRAFCSLESDA